jgi:hypothetical protein
MYLNRYIQHPEQLNRDTLYDLRSYVALYPYHQAARLLMLHNMYLLHDPSFDEELRQAAFYITDRTTLFNLVEQRHYTLNKIKKTETTVGNDRTDTLINSFLDTIPEEEPKKTCRKPTAADATVDYVSYMLAYTADDKNDNPEQVETTTTSIIDNFLGKSGGKITLNEQQEETKDAPHNEVELANDKDELEEGYYTQTLAKIYIKQGKYSKALEIINQLNLNNSKKNVYFADQMRFLEKIIFATSHNKSNK